MASFGGSAAIEIDASPRECFELVCDAARASDWQQAVTAAQVLERGADGRAALVRTGIDAIVDRIEVDLRFEYEPYERIRISREAGELRSATATWTFEALAGGRTLATYTTEIDPGRVASMLARGPIVARLERLLVAQPPQGLRRALER